MANTAIIFGANGFIGRQVASALSADGWLCVGVDRYGHATGEAEDIEIPYYSGSDWSSVALSRFLQRCGPAVVVNAVGAAWSTDPLVVLRDNVVWPRRLAEACVLSGATESLLHIGSSHEYGDTTPGSLVYESNALAPVTEYGKLKTKGASYLVRASYRMNKPLTLLRAFNVIGPGHGTNGLWASAVGLYRSAARTGIEPIVAKVPFPETARDLVDVRDVASLVSLAVRRSGPSVAVYNAASGTATSIRQLFDAFTNHTGIPYKFENDSVGLRIGSKWQCADIKRAESHFGWNRRFSITDSISAALAID